ncbi:MAG: hypothetical protein CMM25_00920 [Rhodospirillaceae bacterium]|nr:hypothetical protein [Rhodospirillaceae bacterium]
MEQAPSVSTGLSGKLLLTRRQVFLSTLASGGLMMGVKAVNAALSEQSGSMIEFNMFVQIGSDDKISIVVPGSEIGQGVYTTLPKIVAEEMDADWDKVEVRLPIAHEAYGNPNKDDRRQTTGNSDAVVGYYDLLRQTGAAVRDLLVKAAKQTLNVSDTILEVRDSIITDTVSGRSVSFGEVAELASQLEVSEDISVKDTKDFRLLGKSGLRKDTPLKVDGSAVYGADISLEGKLYAALRLSPKIGGVLVNYSADKILKRQGVKAVTEVDGGLAVIANTFWEAKKAAEAIDVEWDTSNYDRVDTDVMMDTMKAALDSTARPFFGTKGDAPAVIENSKTRFEAEYEVPFLAHTCMEPLASTALVTNKYCKMWSPHQQQGAARTAAAQITGFSEDNIELQTTFAGGGFGRKWELDFARQSVQAAMAVRNHPVSLIWTREQDVQHDFFRGSYVARVRGAFDDEGGLTAIHTRLVGESLLRYQNRPKKFPDPTVVGGAITQSYTVANKLLDYVESELIVPIGFWRGVSGSQNGFFAEASIDEMSHLVGKDPYLFRRNLIGDKARELAVLDKVAKMSGWGRSMPKGRGLGIAFCPGFGAINAQVAEVEISKNVLKVVKVWCAYDCGFAFDPSNVVHQMESGITYALSAVMFGKIDIKEGVVQQSNFHDYDAVRLSNMPEIEVELIDSNAKIGGAGEASVPATAPAVTNAIYAASGQRIRRLPLAESGLEFG